MDHPEMVSPDNNQNSAAPAKHVGLTPRRSPLAARLVRSLPNVLVLALLGIVAVWGQRTGWKLPKFSAVVGQAEEGKDDWCAEHNVPESICVECKPELLLRRPAHGWCEQHGVQDCPWCHPDVAELSEPTKVDPADVTEAQRALAAAARATNNPQCKLFQRRIQFASLTAFERTGIEVESAQRGPLTESIAAFGEVGYDQTRLVRLSSRVAGTAFRTLKGVGEQVQAGDVLALIDSPEVGQAKAEYLNRLAEADFHRTKLDRAKGAIASGAIPDFRFQEAVTDAKQAEIHLRSAEQALANLGMPVPTPEFAGLSADALAARVKYLGIPAAITPQQLAAIAAPSTLLSLRSPLAGVVVSREVAPGEAVDTAKVLYVVADLRRIWLTLDVRLEDAQTLAVGQTVEFRPDGRQEEFQGTISWISTAADEKTRTLKVRANLDNVAGRLPVNTFGAGRIVLRQAQRAVLVPTEAVQWEGCCHVVFVEDKNFTHEGSPKVFHTRQVRLGAQDGRFTEIVAGVLPGELVATVGSAVLRGELLKDKLGAGDND